MKNLFKSVKLKTAAVMAGIMSLAGVSEMQAQDTQDTPLQDDYVVTINTESEFSDGRLAPGEGSYLVNRADIDSLAQVKQKPAPVLLEEFRTALEKRVDEKVDAVCAQYSSAELMEHALHASPDDCTTDPCLLISFSDAALKSAQEAPKELEQKTGIRALLMQP